MLPNHNKSSLSASESGDPYVIVSDKAMASSG